jgi:predicted RNase H-like nuclease
LSPRVAGLDGFKEKWLAVVLEDCSFADAQVFATAAEAFAQLADCAAIGIDVPIGLPDHPPRRADLEARLAVGPRWQSVFYTCSPAVTEQPTHQEAILLARTRDEAAPSAQAFGLFAKIRTVERLLASYQQVFEVHPEVSFAALNGGPLAAGKRTWNGANRRRELLARAGIDLPNDLGDSGLAPADDVLDAAAVAWTAHRMAAGVAGSLPDPPELIEGRPVAIWY